MRIRRRGVVGRTTPAGRSLGFGEDLEEDKVCSSATAEAGRRGMSEENAG
jgi:hypothetical protein